MTPESIVHGSGRLTRNDGRLTILGFISPSLFFPLSDSPTVIGEHSQVELAQALGIGDHVDGDDLPVR